MRVAIMLAVAALRNSHRFFQPAASFDQQASGFRFAHRFFEVFLFDALASVVPDELRN